MTIGSFIKLPQAVAQMLVMAAPLEVYLLQDTCLGRRNNKGALFFIAPFCKYCEDESKEQELVAEIEREKISVNGSLSRSHSH